MKLILKLIIVIFLLAAGYFALEPRAIDVNLPLAQIPQILPDQSVKTEESPVELIFVGDIMLDRGVEPEIKNNNDWRWPFLKITNELKKADIVFGNLEGPISDKGEKTDRATCFRMDPRVIEGLNYANFNVLSISNNHSLDYGKEALNDTILKLKEAGIDFAPTIKETNGTKFAFLAYTDFCSPSQKTDMENLGLKCLGEDDLGILKKDIESAKKSSDIIIVSFHYGKEFTQGLSQNQIDFSKAAIDAGADLVVGHHPHVVQKYEIYPSANSGQAKYIFYSLGNFVFDENFSEETMQGLMVKVTVKDKKIEQIVPIKTRLNDHFQVEIASSTTSTSSVIPTISLSSSNLVQGDTLLIKVKNVKNIENVRGTFNSKEIKFFETNGKIFGLVGITAKTAPGNYNLTVNLADGKEIKKQIKVSDANFKITKLAFTPELEEKGYNATSVAQTIAENDGVKLYQAMEASAKEPYFNSSFTYPLAKITNVGAFGSIRKSGDVSLQHLGIDLDADTDTPVYAINDGKVAGVLELIDYGNTVVIDHGLGIFSLYLHLDKFKVSLGQKVKKDQIIGLSGNTGYSIAPHLHFSVKLNGASVDPLKFIETAQF